LLIASQLHSDPSTPFANVVALRLLGKKFIVATPSAAAFEWQVGSRQAMTMTQGGAEVSLLLLQAAATYILNEMEMLLKGITFGFTVSHAKVQARDDRRNCDDGFTPFDDMSGACIDHIALSVQRGLCCVCFGGRY